MCLSLQNHISSTIVKNSKQHAERLVWKFQWTQCNAASNGGEGIASEGLVSVAGDFHHSWKESREPPARLPRDKKSQNNDSEESFLIILTNQKIEILTTNILKKLLKRYYYAACPEKQHGQHTQKQRADQVVVVVVLRSPRTLA
jgi:hypothetical protein